ncbi:hypothetical protein Hanom_Chr05g00392191 [Helianthus anomalus]
MDFQTGDYGTPTNIRFPFPSGLNDMTTLAHLHGLLCVSLQPTHDLVLWNLTTTAYKILSTLPTKESMITSQTRLVYTKGPRTAKAYAYKEINRCDCNPYLLQEFWNLEGNTFQ